jgi:hydrogenase maturation factor
VSDGAACGIHEEHCITCGDEAIEMTVVRVRDDDLALCERADGARSSVETALVAPVQAGDRLLVHAGTAIAHGQAPAA